MKKIILYILFVLFPLLGGIGVGFAQTNVPPPHVINAAGGSTKIAGGNYYAYNIGEPIAGTGHNGNGTNYYTQGFLQPDYKIGTAFNAGIYFFNESCQGAQDGSIITNAYNNKGPVKYTLTPNPSGADTTAHITNLSPGTYTLSIQDSVGKVLTHTITIAASNETCPVTTYHAFSPNGDGLNDLYIISGIENYPDNHVYIFNRWGTLVWDRAKYDNVKNVWDGKDNKGATLSTGTYFYVIEGVSNKSLKNWVELTR